MVAVRLSCTTIELDTSFFPNVDADPGLVLQCEVIKYCSLLHRLLWVVYHYFLACYSAEFTDCCILLPCICAGEGATGSHLLAIKGHGHCLTRLCLCKSG